MTILLLFSSLHIFVDKQGRIRARTNIQNIQTNFSIRSPTCRCTASPAISRSWASCFCYFLCGLVSLHPSKSAQAPSCKHFRRALQGHEGKTAGATFGGAYSTSCGLYPGSRRASTLCRMRTRTVGHLFLRISVSPCPSSKPFCSPSPSPLDLPGSTHCDCYLPRVKSSSAKHCGGTVLDLVSRERPENRSHARKRKRGGRKAI